MLQFLNEGLASQSSMCLLFSARSGRPQDINRLYLGNSGGLELNKFAGSVHVCFRMAWPMQAADVPKPLDPSRAELTGPSTQPPPHLPLAIHTSKAIDGGILQMHMWECCQRLEW